MVHVTSISCRCHSPRDIGSRTIPKFPSLMAEKAEAEHFIWFCSWFISTRLSYAAYLLTGFNLYVCVVVFFLFVFFFPLVRGSVRVQLWAVRRRPSLQLKISAGLCHRRSAPTVPCFNRIDVFEAAQSQSILEILDATCQT